jgi:hypothetical protein
MPDSSADASADAAPRLSEETIQRGMDAAEYFEAYERQRELEEAEDQLIATGIGALIGLVIVLVHKLRKSS